MTFFLEGVEQTALGAVQTARRLVTLFDDDTRRTQAIGRGAANALRVLAALRQRPVLFGPLFFATSRLRMSHHQDAGAEAALRAVRIVDGVCATAGWGGWVE